uniref:Uncharacterized protein n=1 Tax=Chlamydomonas euryale TaxID=1486919 RepID=A0A7R9W065_9CHLO|eukprot:361278-Chlamydomonas_euryale.AAC.9
MEESLSSMECCRHDDALYRVMWHYTLHAQPEATTGHCDDLRVGHAHVPPVLPLVLAGGGQQCVAAPRVARGVASFVLPQQRIPGVATLRAANCSGSCNS